MTRACRLAAASLVLALSACATTTPRNPLAQWEPSPNVEERRPQLIVLHYTEQESVAQSLYTLSNVATPNRVSAHYLVGDDGRIYQLVSDAQRAWHAGAGRWGTITDVNSASIGIEIDNDGSEPYSEAQFAALVRLLEDLSTRHRIPRTQVIGHSDLAPTRKIDPGPRFPWKRLFDAGFGIWPQPGLMVDPPPGFNGWMAMRTIGYPLADRAAALRAFRTRFRARDDGPDLAPELDAEDLRILHALTASP